MKGMGVRAVSRDSSRVWRSLRSSWTFSPRFLRMQLLPSWVLLSLVTNSVLAIALLVMLVRQSSLPLSPASDSVSAASLPPPPLPTSMQVASVSMPPPANFKPGLTYGQWLDQLGQEAKAIVAKPPKDLTVLAGDSISLWFPEDLWPESGVLLNQGISGETSTGLLKRLYLFDQTEPTTIFVMIGINDLLRGQENAEILDNQQQIIRYLREEHPKTHIVVQSILPHAVEQVTWEGRDRLLAIPNSRIRELNRSLQAIAQTEQVSFLDLYPLFANPQGDLRRDLSSDGLHLNRPGYQVWSAALQVYHQLEAKRQTGNVSGDVSSNISGDRNTDESGPIVNP